MKGHTVKHGNDTLRTKTTLIAAALLVAASTAPAADAGAQAKLTPAGAFMAVPYRDLRFWIDDRDMLSKRLFSFPFFIFTLVETSGQEAPTALTVPVG